MLCACEIVNPVTECLTSDIARPSHIDQTGTEDNNCLIGKFLQDRFNLDLQSARFRVTEDSSFALIQHFRARGTSCDFRRSLRECF